MSDDDRRAIELSLTESGEALVADVVPLLRANDSAAAAMLEEDERQTLMRLLRKIAGWQPPAEGGP